MKKFFQKSILLFVFLSFLVTAMRVNVLSLSKFSVEMEEILDYSEKEFDDVIDDDDCKEEPLFFEKQTPYIQIFYLKSTRGKMDSSYRNPLIEIPDSPPKLVV